MVFLGVLLLLILAPMAGMMLPKFAPDNDTFYAKPTGGFQYAADPVNTIADSVITNMDDTDNLYGGAYRQYVLTLNVSDADGANTLANVTATFGSVASFLWLNTTAYHGTTGCITQPLGSSLLTLVSSTNTTTASGNTLNITITFEVEWAMTDADNIALAVLTYSTDGGTDTDTKAAYVDFDTDVVLSSSDFVSTHSVGTSGAITFSSSVVVSYEDSGGDNYPLAAETDFWATRTPATGSDDDWESTGYSDVTGIVTFDAITAGHIAQLETYTFDAYTQGSTTTTLMGSTHTDTVDVSNSGGGGGDDDPVIGGFTPQQMLIGVFLVIGGYLVYSIFLSGGKSKARGRSKSKSKKKRRR